MADRSGIKKLTNWCRNITQGYKDVDIKDMSSSWRDGLAFCSIIAHFRPDLIDFSTLSKENVYHNNSLAFSVAEKQLGIPTLLDAEDMVNCTHLDSLSICTYLSELYKYFEDSQKGKLKDSSSRGELNGSDDKERESKVFKYASVSKTNFNKCQACKNAVYILERLIVDGRLYHRSCFKCYKCDALLNPGAYLGDSPGTYECEICPKDEVIRRKNTLLRQLEGDKEDSSSSSSDSSTEEEIITPSVHPSQIADTEFIEKSFESSISRPQSTLKNISSSESMGILENQKEFSIGEKDHSKSSYAEDDRKSLSITQEDSLESTSIDQEYSKSSSEHFLGSKSSASLDIKCPNASENVENCKSVFSMSFLKDICLEDTDSVSNKENFFSAEKSKKPVIKSSSYVSTLLVNEFSRPNSTDDLSSISKTDKEASTLLPIKRSMSSEADLDSFLHGKWSKISNSKLKNLEKLNSYKELHKADKEIEPCLPEELKGKSEIKSEVLNESVADEDIITDRQIFKEHPMSTALKEDELNEAHETENIKKEEPVLKSTGDTLKKEADENEYPEDLNPFDDEDDCHQEISVDKKLPSAKDYPKTFNPFGSDEEDEVDSVVISKIRAVTPKTKKLKEYDESLNPFGSDDDEVDSSDEIKKLNSTSFKQSEPPWKPTPAVRVSLVKKTLQESPVEPSDRSIKTSTPSPTGSLKSLQKKRKAPAPPSPATTPLKPPRTLITKPSSPRFSLKSKPAPPPPLQTKPNFTNSTPDKTVSNDCKSPDKDQDKTEEESLDLQTSDTSQSPKKKKRPAPSVPVPPRRQIKIIPVEEIHKEMEEIEKKQLELEQKGRTLELKIRNKDKEELNVENEELIVELFDLLNVKNALFRRRAELMHIKRSQRLEEEQADLEYQIRLLMSKPNDKKSKEELEKEQELLEKLIDVVEQRNEIVESIEMDRRRVAEEEENVFGTMERKKGESPLAENEVRKKSKKSKKNKKEKKDKEKKKKKKKEEIKEEKTDGQKTEKPKKKKWL